MSPARGGLLEVVSRSFKRLSSASDEVPNSSSSRSKSVSDVTALEAKDQNGLARRRSWLPRKKRRSSGKNFSGPTSLPNAPGLPGAPQSQTAPPLSSATATLAAAFKSQLAYPDAVRPAASGGARWAHIKGEERAEQILASVVETWMGAASRTRSTTRTSRMSIGANGNNARMSSAGEYSSPEHRRRSSWTASFLDADPRRQILDFFMPGDERGPFGLLRSKKLQPSGKVVSKFFSIWRPTSFDAIRMMMEGKATGKGLNIKGKSAKKGKLSGFVPVGTSPPYATVRIYYASEELRSAAVAALTPVLEEMVSTAAAAKRALEEEKETGVQMEDEVREVHLSNLRFHMDQPVLTELDAAGHGLEMPERLMWEAYVMRQDISQPPGFESGRPSEPDYMHLNMQSTRKWDPEQSRVVVFQQDVRSPMNPITLLVAYEEGKAVLPVVSDFDAFLFGSRGVQYPEIPADQVPFLQSLVKHVEQVLSTPGSQTWTHRWLEILKGEVKPAFSAAKPSASKPPSGAAGGDKGDGKGKPKLRRQSISGSFGGRRADGPYGFGDDISRAMIEEQCAQLHGAVRHAAESFNYYWPQELDSEFLIIWDGYPSTKWRYVNNDELRAFLIERANDGFAFPLNPTWILRDEGWYDVFQALERSPGAQQALDAWLPPSSGLRERMKAIHDTYPDGFVRTRTSVAGPDITAGSHDRDLAELALKRHQTLKRAKLKLRTVLLFVKLGRKAALDANPPPVSAAPSAAPEPEPEPEFSRRADDEVEPDMPTPKLRPRQRSKEIRLLWC